MGNTAMDSAGKILMVGGFAAVLVGVVGNAPPVESVGVNATFAMWSGMLGIGLGSVASIFSKSAR